MAFLQALRAGRLLPPDLTEAILTPQVLHHEAEAHTIRYGFGMQFLTVGDRVRSMYKEGVNAGASAFVEHYPDRGLDVVVLAATENGAWAPLREVTSRMMAAAGS